MVGRGQQTGGRTLRASVASDVATPVKISSTFSGGKRGVMTCRGDAGGGVG